MKKIETTFFIIKPEAFKRRAQIKRFILSNSNLEIVESAKATLTARDIREIYLDDLKTPLLRATIMHYKQRAVEIGVIKGENAVSVFSKLCGTDPDPKKCEPGTIRREFGNKRIIKYGEVTYYLNSIHRSSQNEAETCVKWFYKAKGPRPL